MKLWVLALFVFLSQCKTTQSTKSETVDSSANALSLASTVPDTLKCGRSDGNVQKNFPFPIAFEDKTMGTSDTGSLYLETLYQSLSTLPTSILNAFADINGNILLVNDAKSHCEFSTDTFPSGIGSCWGLNADQSFTLYISMNDQSKKPSLSALSFNSLMAFGQLFEKIFINDMIHDGEDLFYTGNLAYQGAESFRFDIVQELLNVTQTKPRSAFPLDLSSFMLSHSFFTYYCSDTTRSELKQLFPKAYATIQDLTDHFTPKPITDLKSTTAENDFELGYGTYRTVVDELAKATKSFRHTIKAKILAEPRNISKITKVSNFGKGDGIEFLKSKVRSKEQADDIDSIGLNYSEVPGILGGGYYYTGAPRLISEKPIDLASLSAQKKSVTILIHGTFAGHGPVGKPIAHEACCWSTPGGDVANAFKPEDGEVLSFQWSGLLQTSARKDAGVALANMIEAFHAAGIEVNLVGHSHGANVGAAAIHEIRERKHGATVKDFIAIGAPVPNERHKKYRMSEEQFTGQYIFVTGKNDAVQGMTGAGTQSPLSGDKVVNVEITGSFSGHSELMSLAVIQEIRRRQNLGLLIEGTDGTIIKSKILKSTPHD